MSKVDPLERLARAAESAAGNDPRVATFARGLVIGALVGAAVAGSTILQRRQGRAKALPQQAPEPPAVASPAVASPTDPSAG